MPYIKQDKRYSAKQNPSNEGELNFVISSTIDAYIQEKGMCYATLNEVIGVLECAKLELYRRVAAPYEDRKAVLNGEVYTSVHGEK